MRGTAKDVVVVIEMALSIEFKVFKGRTSSESGTNSDSEGVLAFAEGEYFRSSTGSEE